MSNGQDLKELLRPLGVYNLDNSFLGAELESLGKSLDELQVHLEYIQQEMCLTTASGVGLDRIAALFAQRPVTDDERQLARSLAALGRIGGNSFTPSAINNTLEGCGLNAVVAETAQPGIVAVRFPDVPGIPTEFERMRQIIENILPAHVLVQYLFWYVTWAELEAQELTWQEMQEQNMTWQKFETLLE